jgi:hypothetical protein
MPVAGPFYFAKISDGTIAFNSVTHGVMDYFIFSFTLQQAETEFASLDIEIKNPGIDALLAAPLWCWFSYNGTALFKGRIVALPTNLLATVVTLKYVARPDNYEAQRTAIMADIHYNGRPFWDPIFIDAAHQQDPDAALEALAEDWHTDRLTLEVTTSDILVGEDGAVVFTLGEAFLDDLDVQISEAPVQAVDVDATVPWKQAFGGTIDFGIFSWKGAGTENVINAWPKTGDQLSGGWSVAAAAVEYVAPLSERKNISVNFSWQNKEKTHRNGDTMSLNASYSGPPGGPEGSSYVTDAKSVIGDEYTGTPASASISMTGVYSQNATYGAGRSAIVLGYGTDRERTEKITFQVRSDLQPVLRPTNDQTVPEKISKSGSSVQALIGDSGAASYFMTDRGNWSVEYLIMLAVARLKLASRIVKVTWGTTFLRAMELTCRKSAQINDPRLQHGTAIGKITSYSMTGNGDSGEFKGSCTIGCAIGLGNSVSPLAGTPTYCDADYVGDDYQMYTGAVIPIGLGDVGYSPPIIVPNDDGLIFPLTKDQVVVKLVQHLNEFVPPTEVVSPVQAAQEIAAQFGDQPRTPQELLQQMLQKEQKFLQTIIDERSNLQSWLELELKDLTTGTFGSESTIEVANLVLPRQYNVSA